MLLQSKRPYFAIIYWTFRFRTEKRIAHNGHDVCLWYRIPPTWVLKNFLFYCILVKSLCFDELVYKPQKTTARWCFAWIGFLSHSECKDSSFRHYTAHKVTQSRHTNLITTTFSIGPFLWFNVLLLLCSDIAYIGKSFVQHARFYYKKIAICRIDSMRSHLILDYDWSK